MEEQIRPRDPKLPELRGQSTGNRAELRRTESPVPQPDITL